MKTTFTIRKNKTKGKLSPIYLYINCTGYERIREHLHLYIDHQKWDSKIMRIKASNNADHDINLILDNLMARITEIKTSYRLSNIFLRPTILRDELSNKMSRTNFISFYLDYLKSEKVLLKKGTYKRYLSVYRKLKKYKPEILFYEITEEFILTYKSHLKKIGNETTTINSNIIAIKKYLRKAEKAGIKMPLDVNDVVGGNTNGNRSFLDQRELKLCFQYFHSQFISKEHKLILAYFLFSCMTGLRIADVQKIKRDQVSNENFTFTSSKTGKQSVMLLNNSIRKVIDNCPDLFIKNYAEAHLNREIKRIMRSLSIDKHVTYHVSRHTFATSFLKAGGKVEELQTLLQHSKIETTMIYVHVINEEANEKIRLLDDYLS